MTRVSKLAVDTGLTLENEAKKDRNGPHKSSKKVHKAIIGSTNESDNNRAIVKDNDNELAIIKTAINELAATVAGLAQRVSKNTQQANCSHNPTDEDVEEGEDKSIIEPPPKHAREDARDTYDSRSGLMDAFAIEFNVTEKCGPAVNEKLAEVVTNILANGIDSHTVTEKSKAYERPQNMAMLDITCVEPLVWDIIQSVTRSADIKLQKIQASITRGLIPLIMAAQKCVEANTQLININDVFPAMSDSSAFLADATHTLNLLRWDSIKADLKPDFKALCAHKNPVGTTLFGDEVEKQIKEISETHKIAYCAACRP